MTADPAPPLKVTLLALPESTPAALFGLYEVLVSVGVVWPTLMGGEPGPPGFDVCIASADGQPFDCPVGTSITPHASIAAIGHTDIVIVTDLALKPDTDPRGNWPEVAAWTRRQYGAGAHVCSVCTGSVLLADAGLLDGCEATTHWSATGVFGRCFPSVDLKPERILLPTGPEHRIVTGGGASSWEDLAIYLVARFRGREEAVRTTRVFLFGDRSEGQLPYAAMAPPHRHEDAVIGACQTWIAGHYEIANPVARMVRHSGLAERTFKRRFRAATGYTPVAYVQALRIEEAKHMLETTGDPTDEIGRAVGYEDSSHFRRLFKRLAGVTPGRYRQRYRTIAGTAA